MAATIDDETAAGRAAADRLADDWDTRDWVPTSPTLEWARAAVERFGEILLDTRAIVRASLKGADKGAATLSPRPFQGLIECLQNADDLGASCLHVAYRASPRPELLIVHDGEPVTLAHVGAMLLPWLSTKDKDAEAAGRFGIGQRTLAALGGPIAIHASPFHFVMSEQGPVGLSPHPDLDGVYRAGHRDTMLVIPLAAKVTSESIIDAVRQLEVDALIFLRSIRAVRFHHLGDPSQNLVFAVEVNRRESGQIEFKNGVASVEIDEVDVVSPAELAQRYRRYSTRRNIELGEYRSNKATGPSTPIGVCVPITGPLKPLRLYDRMPLPVLTGLPIGLNAQFDPDAARSTLLPNEWNRSRICDLGQLVAWAALHAFEAPDSTAAWNHVPLKVETENGKHWIAEQVRELIVDASQEILREKLMIRTSAAATPLNNIAYEADELESVLTERDVERLTGKVALPRRNRDPLQRWHLVLSELGTCELVTVAAALSVVDGDTQRGVDWYVLFSAIAERNGLFMQFIRRPGLILADGAITAGPTPTDIWLLVKKASPAALSTRLGLVRRLHPAYFDDAAETGAFVAKLQHMGLLFEDRDAPSDVFSIFKRGAPSFGTATTKIRVEDPDLLALRDAWAELPRERQGELGGYIGQRIELKATWYDTDGKRVNGWARPVETYLPASIDHDTDNFAKAAGRTPGIKWVDSEYAKILKQAAGRAAIGPQRLLCAWGVAREPRLIPPKDECVVYVRDPTPASPVWTNMRTQDQSLSIRAGGGYVTHLLEDHWSPDAEAVALDIARAPVKLGRRRGGALLGALSRGWERRYSEHTTTVTAYGNYGWIRGIEVRATWLARLADIRWMPDAGGGLQRPSDLQMQAPGSPPRPNERSSTIYRFDPQIQRSGVLAALGVKAGPTQRDLVERLRSLRQVPVTAAVEADALAVYQLLSASLRNRNEGIPEGRMTPAQLKNAFRAGADGLGLLLVNGAWHSPEALLRGPAIFGKRRAFAPHVEGLDLLWSTLGVELPSGPDAIDVLKEIAKGEPSPQDLGIAIRAFSVLSGALAEMSPQARAVLRRLPLWTGSEWATQRPIYALEGEALLSSASAALRVWKPGLTSFASISQLLEPLGVIRLSPSDFHVASIPSYGVADGQIIRPDFAKAVALLRQELVRADPALLDGLTVDWEQLITAQVAIDPSLSIVARLESGVVQLAARAHFSREPLCLILRSPSEARTAEGAGSAVASLFNGDRQKVAWAWASVWPRAVDGEQPEGAVLPKTQADRGDGKERLDQLAQQAARRRKAKGQPDQSEAKTGTSPRPLQVRKLRELDELEPSAGIVVNQGAKPTGSPIFTSRQRTAGERRFNPGGAKVAVNSAAQRSVLPPAGERERLAFDAVRRALRLDVQQFNDLRSARGVGVDAVDELRQCYEIKMSSDSAVPNEITLTASEVEAARSDPDFFLAVVSGLEDGAGKLRVRFIFDPLAQLDVRVRGDLTLTGVSRAEALEFEFDNAEREAES